MTRKSKKEKSSNLWTITFEGESGSTDDYQVEFFDCFEMIGGLCIVPSYIDKIGDLQENNENYLISADIKYIKTDLVGDLSDKFFMVIFAEDKDSQTIGLLLAEHQNGEKYPLIALWPIKFYNKVEEDINYLNKVLAMIVEEPDNWKRVELILPIKE
ncbi:MAG: hypothetical protein GF329_05015 [Candidatus Lokiarchaeota archaeon]|nr:hypothetical protein [Candidatus Lokiarchaeota archaeon]